MYRKPLEGERMLSGADLIKRGVSLNDVVIPNFTETSKVSMKYQHDIIEQRRRSR